MIQSHPDSGDVANDPANHLAKTNKASDNGTVSARMPAASDASNAPPLESMNTSRRFTVNRNGRMEKLTFEQLFATGHRLWMRKDYETARSVFTELMQASDRGPRAAIFLAHCHAMLGDYGSCSATLNRALPKDEYGDVATRLHDAFVFWKVGLFVDVRKELSTMTERWPSLPSLSLILGDLFLMTGAMRRSKQFLLQAIRNDRQAGGVALAAESSLRAIELN